VNPPQDGEAVELRFKEIERRLYEIEQERHQFLELFRQAFLMIVRYLDGRLGYSRRKNPRI
jgi:hypothetical protein